ncbi:Gfo/Idh/MocA family oxidoreductase [Oerskovia turbata]|uniref:Gfo/Idh/MocA family oxidoreductase n=1 Tax=Oerskovia turbata TaxID=1713 RepID=A0A4Q1KQW3_9CELL|nr:Gfo/Idh/MocA family oxidoreductase [Oerskovia turbata]RXR23112.1 Gfo/Idh/MocA family oxidoreductase [Oerskovia turbata]RXR31689.1 Gfo/Idh/MocA family oxidoreductase [Oerskovia turbata]TGJ97224.1 gfo/Idh/MocA family oxidoreductase [Actinotalea fermentans ATCC 43279 = JCM 9966 = DSM 3133]
MTTTSAQLQGRAGTPVRIGLVGYGGAGRGIHARLAREAGLVVTAVVARNPERRASAAADWPGVRLHDDLTGLLGDRGAFDVVVIASPSALHAEHAAQVSAAGVPFVLDKPIALDGAQAAEVVATAQAAGTPFTVFQNRRWDPEQLTLRSVLASGDLGRVHTFERRWERWRPVPQQRWKENDPVGGGLLLDLGPHLVDSATQLFGPVRSVYAELRALTTPTEDDVFLTLHHAPSDGREVVSRLWAASVVGAPGPRTRVLGDAGAYVVTTFENDASPFEVFDDAAPDGTEGWVTHGRERRPVPRAAGGHADFYRAVAGWVDGGPVPVEPADAVRTAHVLDVARDSARSGRRLEV